MASFSPGEVYFADLGAAGRRPVIVVSKEEYNRGNYLIAVPCTSARFQTRQHLPSCVPILAGQFGLAKDCVAQCELVTPVETQHVDQNLVGVLDETTFRSVIKAIGHVLNSDCEPI